MTNKTQQAKQVRTQLLGHKPATPQDQAGEQPSDQTPDKKVMTLSNLALSESKTKAPQNKLHKRLWFQILLLSVLGLPVALVGTGMLYGQSPEQAKSEDSGDDTAANLPQSEVEKLTQDNADLKVEIAELRQSLSGESAPPTDTKASAKSGAVPPSPPQTPKPPSAAHRVSKPIPVRQSVPQSQPKPRIVYRDRPKTEPVVAAAPKPAPQPQPVQQEPKPAANFSLTQKSAHTPKPLAPKPPIRISTARPLNRFLLNRKQTTRRQPTVKAPPQGVLVASLTGDLLKDNQAPTGSPVVTDTTERLYQSPEPSLGKGLIAAGTTVKAKLDNPITWIPQNSDAIIGQRYLMTLSEDLGAMAKKGSKVVAEVTSAEGDFLSMQVVEVNEQPIEHIDLTNESPDSRKTPIAVVQYKQSPYLQASLKGQGEGFGNKLLRAGLNAGIDQLRSSSVGDRASSVVNSLAPSRSSSSSRNGLYHFNKEVEIYFNQGV